MEVSQNFGNLMIILGEHLIWFKSNLRNKIIRLQCLTAHCKNVPYKSLIKINSIGIWLTYKSNYQFSNYQ